MADCDCEAILLAAGQSRRMAGVNKLLLPVGGIALVRYSAQLYLRLGIRLTVVTGGANPAVAAALAGLNLALVVNRDADAGQNSSVRTGLAAASLTAAGIIIALADQPLLTTDDIRALVAEFKLHDAARICVPCFAGRRGNPVIFPVAVARRLCQPGCMSPRAFIDAHPELMTWFAAANDHFIRDVDTRADAALLLGVAP